MNGQARTFVKQVQVDLLALSDADLFHTIQQWVDGNDPSAVSFDVPEDTRFALGYTLVPSETTSWQAPSPQLLRTLLTAMDVNLFARHVITLAFQSLHTLYPEWYDGLTFNAHLANYLRQMRIAWPSHPVDIATTSSPYHTR